MSILNVEKSERVFSYNQDEIVIEGLQGGYEYLRVVPVPEDYYVERVLRYRVVKQFNEDHPHYEEVKENNPEVLDEWWLVSSHPSFESAEDAIENQHDWELDNGYTFKVVDRGSESVHLRNAW